MPTMEILALFKRPAKSVLVHVLFLFVATLLFLTGGHLGLAQEIDFEKDVEPIFAAKCLRCHGPTKQKSNFRVDQRASFLSGGDYENPVINPGSAGKSILIAIVSGTDEDLTMPPKGEKLSSAEIRTLIKWIDAGAKMPATAAITKPIQKSFHWSLQPVRKFEPPKTDSENIAPIDAFIKQRLGENGLSFSNVADRRTLIERLYMVMLGMPPTPAEVDLFVNDSKTDSWQRLVDRVLANPQYGERWARHWLDVVRYGETDGYETNRERPHAWRYRDWVIDAFNFDKPYDKFIIEQIAGDVVGQEIGTGFLVAGPRDIVKSPDINLTLTQRQDELADMINTSGTAFLGLTLGCARCHDHKFDPISQKDFYSWQAVFAGVQHGDRAIQPSPAKKKSLDELSSQLADLRLQLHPFVAKSKPSIALIDDQTAGVDAISGFFPLKKLAGTGKNPAGTDPGFAQDPGSSNRIANISGGTYSWWENEPGQDYAIYRPTLNGRYRVWISWGCGFETHSKDAVYVLDRDGDPATTSDQKVIARIDQQKFANNPASGNTNISTTIPFPAKPLWSGLQSIGQLDLSPGNALIIRGGETGTAITADLIVLEAVTDDNTSTAQTPVFRAPVSAQLNVEKFKPRKSKFVRFQIRATNSAEPCLDELEVFSGNKNVALSSNGSAATCSGSFAGNPKHKLKHINDGKFGNNFSWISNEKGGGWIQIEFPSPTEINEIRWARDREKQFADRLATAYLIESSLDGENWVSIASSNARLPLSATMDFVPVYNFENQNDANAKRGRDLLARAKVIETQLEQTSKPELAYIGNFDKAPPKTFRLFRGDPMSKREEVAPDAVTIIGSLDLSTDTPEHERRLKLAQWIADKNNPLTARVMVNRLWQHHFGKGLVGTVSDFGANGAKPTHPQLLDWLATEFIECGWSVKSMHRKILLSKTWQQQSTPNAKALAIDADSRLLWRFPNRRLEAEAIRDRILATSGVLDGTMGGPGFSAFEVQLENVRHYFPKKQYGPEDWRRMIYMTKVRQEHDSVFGVFDCPDASQVMPRRSRSTNPLQALNLFNSQFILQQAEFLAKRLQKESGDSIENQIRRAYQLCFARSPADDELATANSFVDQHGMKMFCRALFNSNEFLFIQ